MAIRFKKSVFKIGKSHAITLPNSWLAYYGDRANKITLMGGSILLVVPQGLEFQGESLIKHMEDMPWLSQQDYEEASHTKTTEECIEA